MLYPFGCEEPRGARAGGSRLARRARLGRFEAERKHLEVVQDKEQISADLQNLQRDKDWEVSFVTHEAEVPA